MAEDQFVSYLRVSTAKQGHSGLGLEAQRKAVADYLNGGQWQLVTEVVEIESGKRSDRPKLEEALRLCRLHNATLVIAKLDRLSRDAHFLLGLEKAGVDFVAADMPSANRLTVGIMAMVADEERRMISRRTKEALAAAKARGKKLGGNRGNLSGGGTKGHVASLATRQAKARSRASDLAPVIEELKASGAVSLRQIAAGLNAKGIRTARGGAWSAMQVQRVMERV
jgi:DNA invertase Pin-like site-specific DNA recombinase